MTVQNTVVKNIYKGNGSTTVFPFTFAFDSKFPEDILVYVTGTDRTTALTTNFTLDITNKNITYPKSGSVLASGEKLTIIRKVPLTQLLNLVNQGAFFAEDIETNFDSLVFMIQQLAEILDRTLAVSVSTDNFNSIIPIEAGMAIEINDTGTGFKLATSPGTVLIQCNGILTEIKAIGVSADEAKNTAVAAAATATQKANEAAVSAENSANQVTLAAAQATKAEQEADNAAASEQAVAGYMANVTVYSATATYNPPDVVMVPNGDCYRCIAQTTGNDPTSTTGYWVLTATATYQTFGLDTNGDLMPVVSPQASASWDIDDNGDIEPING